jgi:hypothetical protein
VVQAIRGRVCLRFLLCASWIAALLAAAPAAIAQPERPAELPRYMGRWIAEGGGWRVVIEITGTAITPSRSLIRIAIACAEEPGGDVPFRAYGHIVEAKELDLLVRYRDARGPLLRLYGTVPRIALATVAGAPACARRTDLPLARAPTDGVERR